MAGRSLRASGIGIQKARIALKRKNLTQKAIATEIALAAWATVNKFFTGKAVDRSIFLEICQFLDLDWQEIAENPMGEAEIEAENAGQTSVESVITEAIALADDLAIAIEHQATGTQQQVFLDGSQVPVADNRSTFPSRVLNFFALDDAWVGRENLIRELNQRIEKSCRLLILVGITGIGKTALGERLAVELEHWFNSEWNRFHQKNFDDEQQSSDFASVAASWLEKWGELITPEDRKDPQRLLYRLVRHLCEHRYLVQIDSLENILQGNEEEGWNDFKDEWWLKFFDSYLKAELCQSCIILTSQDLPGQIEAIGTRSQNFWHCQPLNGLEPPEQMALFEKTQLDISPTSAGRPYLERVGTAYEGHPLALRVIAGEIKHKPFEGNVIAYWNQYGNEIEEVEKAIAQAQEGKTTGSEDKWQLDRFTKALRRNVRSRLNKTFARLKEDAKWAYILLCEASIYRCPVAEDFWLSHLEDWERNEDEQKAALDALRDRYLVEELVNRDHQCLLRQHNLVRSISLEHLKHL
jgi:hypothetical protein